jgi:DNA repair protein RadC
MEDKRTTTRIGECLKMFDIDLIDHIIVTESEYYSFSEEGLI